MSLTLYCDIIVGTVLNCVRTRKGVPDADVKMAMTL